MREHLLIELLLLLEEGAIERMGGRIVEEFEAVEDLDGATLLHTYDTSIDPRRKGRNDPVAAVGGGVVVRCVGWVHLRLDPRVMVGDVNDYQRVQLERQSAAR